MIIKTSTWNRDSCELYDYENTDYYNCTHYLKKNSFLLRIGNKTEITNTYNEKFKESYLLNLFYEEKEHFIQKDIENKFTNEKVWLTLRHYLSSNFQSHYILSEGEIIKVGRIQMKIKYIITQKSKNNHKKDSSNAYKKLKQTSQFDFESKTEIHYDAQNILKKRNHVCRICYCDESEVDSPLLNPCNCSGGVKYIHFSCLQQWLKSKSVTKNISDSHCVTYTLKQIECEICKAILPDALKSDKGTYDIWDFLKPSFANYLVMETLNDSQKTKTVYMLNFDEKKNLKLGRSNDSDIKISDISVSRFHCSFKLWESGQISLIDNKSKFGTLVLLNHPCMPVFQKVCLPLQIGRTLCKFHLKNPFCLFKFFKCWKPNESLKDYCSLNAEFIMQDDILNVKIQAEKDSAIVSEKSLNCHKCSMNDEKESNQFEENNKNFCIKKKSEMLKFNQENISAADNKTFHKEKLNNFISDGSNVKEAFKSNSNPKKALTPANNRISKPIGNIDFSSNNLVVQDNYGSEEYLNKHYFNHFETLKNGNFDSINNYFNIENNKNYNAQLGVSQEIFGNNINMHSENVNWHNKNIRSKSLKNSPSINSKITKNYHDINKTANKKKEINNKNSNSNYKKNKDINNGLINQNNNINSKNREIDDLQLRYECNTSHNQIMSGNEDDNIVQLPAINNINLNLNSIEDNLNLSEYIKIPKEKDSNKENLTKKNFITKSNNNFNPILNINQTFQSSKYPTANLRALNALNVIDLNPNYIPNLSYDEFNEINEINKLRNFQLIGDLLNKSNSIINNNRNIFINNFEQTKQIENNYPRKHSFNFKLKANPTDILYEHPYEHIYKNLNHSCKSINFYKSQGHEHLSNEEYYERPGNKKIAFTQNVSAMHNNRNHKNYDLYSRKKSAKNKSPKKLFNKKFDEDLIQILDANVNSNFKKRGFNNKINNLSNNNKYDNSLRKYSMESRPFTSNLFGISQIKNWEINKTSNIVNNKVISKDMILDPLDIIQDNINNKDNLYFDNGNAILPNAI